MGSVSGVFGDRAHLTGTVTGGEGQTYWWFSYSTDNGANWQSPGAFVHFVNANEGPVAVEEDLTNLQASTEYKVRLAAMSFSDFQEVTTPEPYASFTTLAVEAPEVVSVNAATSVFSSTAKVSGTVKRPADPDSAADLKCRFEYVTDAQFGGSGFGEASQTPCEPDPVKAAGNSAVKATLRSLAPETTYHFRLTVSNAGGKQSVDGPSTFKTTTVQPKILAVNSASEVSYTTATASGSVERPGTGAEEPVFDLDCRFEYISEERIEKNLAENLPEFEFISQVPCVPNPVATTGPTPVSAKLTGLQGKTKYRLWLVVSNAGGTKKQEAPSNFETLTPAAPSVTIEAPTAVTATTAVFHGKVNPGGTDPGFNVEWHFECTPACPNVGGGTISADNVNHSVTAEATGLHVNTAYQVSLVAVNSGNSATAGPLGFTTGKLAVTATTFPAFPIAGGTEALLGAKINAQNSDTTYWFEYGLDDTYGSSLPTTEDAEPAALDEEQIVNQKLTGLQPATTYHFRVVVKDSGGAALGTDETFTTPAGGQGPSIGPIELPDGRTWEMVSPPDKNNADVWKNAEFASVSGDAIIFKSQGSFAGQPTSRGGQLTDYLSQRGSTTWTTKGIAPPRGRFNFNTGYQLASDDLEFALLNRTEFAGEESIDPEAPPATAEDGIRGRTYIRDSDTGTFKLFPNSIGVPSADFSGYAFNESGKLTADSPCNGSGSCVFERLSDGTVRLASVLPGEVPAEGQIYNADGGLSKDGSHVFFTNGGNVYVRVNGTETLQVDKSERTTPPVVVGNETVLVAVDIQHGQRALLRSNFELTDEDTDGGTDLYLFDSNAPSGERLTLISQGDVPGGQVDGYLESGEELQRVYFTMDQQIISGEPTEPGSKLYVWQDDGGQGDVNFIATKDAGMDRRVSPNGQYLAFITSVRLSAYDNQGNPQVYRYDAGTGQLVCVSCDPTGEPGVAGADWNPLGEDGVVTIRHTLRNVSTGGQVFFHTPAALAPKDSNGVQDVYEWTDGLPYLISPGVGPGKARFQDASRDGTDIFFSTTDRLVGWDKDGNNDIYDARVDGGLPEPPLGDLGCEGDSCQPAPTPPNDPTPGSSNFNGAGNVKESYPKPKCKKGKVRKKGKCLKKHKKQKTKKRNGKSTQKNG
jgi:hypothetical protein